MHDIVATLASSHRFRTFVTLLVLTELVDDLREHGTYDVFAPSDDLFERIPHAVMQRFFARKNLEALFNFAERRVQKRERGVRVVDKDVVERLDCSNGTIHVVDRVVVKAMFSAKETPKTGARAVLALSSKLGVRSTNFFEQ